MYKGEEGRKAYKEANPSKSDKQFVKAVDKFRGSSSADLIKRTKERLEFALAIKRFSDAEYFKEIIEYLEKNKSEKV